MHYILHRMVFWTFILTAAYSGNACTPYLNSQPSNDDPPVTNVVTSAGDSTTSPTRVPEKRALLIGIDEYASPDVSDLRGAVNDVKKMKVLLTTKFEFPEENIEVLTDSQATHDGIIEAIQDHLIEPTQAGDIVVLHFSGHGSQMKDGDDDERDGFDETLVPHDSRQPGKYDISDDQIRGLLSLLAEKTNNITFVFDSCHSGTGNRAAGLIRRVKADERTPPPAPNYAVKSLGSDGGLWRQGDNFVLLSGTRSDLLSYEYVKNNTDYGAFTYFLTEELEHAGAGATYRDIIEQVRSNVKAYYPSQSPQIEGTGEDSYVFSDSTSLAEPYVLVSPRSSSTVTIDAGKIHGMTTGSIFEVYAPGTKQFEGDAPPVAQVKLTTLGESTSVGELTSGSNIEPNSRAIETKHAFPNQFLRVFLENESESALLQDLRSRLDTLNYIDIHHDSIGSVLVLKEGEVSIVIEGPDRIALSNVPTRLANVADSVASQVEQWARWYNVWQIRNPAPKVEVDVAISATELYAGDLLDMTVSNKSDRSLFIIVLDISSDGSITKVFPANAASEVLLAGGSTTIAFPTFVPDDRAIVRDYLKVIATTRELNFRSLTMPPIQARGLAEVSTRNGDVSDPFLQLLDQAASGVARGVGGGVTLGYWVTEQPMITVRKR